MSNRASLNRASVFVLSALSLAALPLVALSGLPAFADEIGRAPTFDLRPAQTFMSQNEMMGVREGRSATVTPAALRSADTSASAFDLGPGQMFKTQGEILAGR